MPSRATLTHQERIAISLSQINWNAIRATALLNNFRAANEVNQSEVLETLTEEYDKQLADTAYLLDDISQTLANFMNDHDSVDKLDQLVLDGGFEALRNG